VYIEIMYAFAVTSMRATCLDPILLLCVSILTLLCTDHNVWSFLWCNSFVLPILLSAEFEALGC